MSLSRYPSFVTHSQVSRNKKTSSSIGKVRVKLIHDRHELMKTKQ
jgi:hypothetical protein